MQNIIRHTLAAAGGYLALDVSSTQSIIGGIVMILAACLWSWLQKVVIFDDAYFNDDTKAAVQKTLGILISQLIAAFTGAMLHSGFAGDVNDPVAVSVFLANLGASKLGWHQKAVGAKTLLFFAASAFLCGHLTSCSNTAQEALKRRAEEAALEVGKQATVVGVEGTLNWLRKELKTLEAKPVDEDPYQQLIDQNRISALKAAIKSGEEQLVKLRAPSAKQPIVVQIEDKKMTGKKMGSLTADIFLSDIFLSPTSVVQNSPRGARALLPASFQSPHDSEGAASICRSLRGSDTHDASDLARVEIPQLGQLVAAHLASN